MLEHIITSKTRRKILNFFFQHLGTSYHMRRIAREVDEEINAVKRELDILEKAGVLEKEKRLNKILFTLNSEWIFYSEFISIFIKSSPLVRSIMKNISRIGKVHFVVISEKYAKKTPLLDSEIYILIIGTVVANEIVELIKKSQEEFPYEINYTIMTKEEFSFRKKNKDPFIWHFLNQPKIMVIGQESQLMA